MEINDYDFEQLKKSYDDFIFFKFKEEFKKIGIEIKSIDCLNKIKEDILQLTFKDNINVFYKKEPLFIYNSFNLFITKL